MTVGGPGTLGRNLLLSTPGLGRRQHDALHHLPDDAVGENHGGVAVTESQLESQVDEVGHLLYGGGRQDNDVVVAVAATARRLVVVALTGLYGAQSRAAALHVDD